MIEWSKSVRTGFIDPRNTIEIKQNATNYNIDSECHFATKERVAEHSETLFKDTASQIKFMEYFGKNCEGKQSCELHPDDYKFEDILSD